MRRRRRTQPLLVVAIGGNALLAGADPVPFDVLVAESEGLIGYLLAEEIGRQIGPERVVVLLTLVVVDRQDPAFARPTKPIGAVLSEAEARLLAAERGCTVGADGDGWRRMVPSPEPREIVEFAAIRSLADAGYVVVCAEILAGTDTKGATA